MLTKTSSVICVFFLSSCVDYGPKEPAKVANALQTLMATLIEGSFSSLGGGGSAPVDCAVSGSYTAGNTSYGTFDPLNPDATEITTPITFDNCVIKVCGDTFTVNGSGTAITLSLGALNGLTGEGSEETRSASIEVSAADQEFSAGFLTGTLTFGYNMTATVGNSTLESIVIEDITPANPLEFNSRSYPGDQLGDLSDGC